MKATEGRRMEVRQAEIMELMETGAVAMEVEAEVEEAAEEGAAEGAAEEAVVGVEEEEEAEVTTGLLTEITEATLFLHVNEAGHERKPQMKVSTNL